MPITVTCTCGKTLTAPDSAAGRKARCPACKTVLEVPAGAKGALDALSGARTFDAMAPVPKPERPFLVEAQLAFLYPLRGGGVFSLLVMAGVALIAVVLPVGLLTLPIKILGIGYLCAYYLDVVQSSAGGDAKLPGMPDLTDIMDDVLKPMLFMLVALLSSALPQLAYYVYAATQKVEPNRHLVAFLGVWTSFYFPMAVMSVAIWRSVAAVSPHIVLPTIFRIPGQHLMTAALVWLTWNGFTYLTVQVVQLGLSSGSLWGTLFLVSMLLIYFGCVTARMIGITHWVYRKQIGWFRSL